MAILCIPLERARKGSFPDDTPSWLREILREFAQDVAASAPDHHLAYHLPWDDIEASAFASDEDGNVPPTLYPIVEPPERAIFDIAQTPELAIRLVQWRAELIERRTVEWLEEEATILERLSAEANEEQPLEGEPARLPEPPEGAPSA
jgi:hypothetical protein